MSKVQVVSTDKLNILDVGCGEGSIAQGFWPEATVHRLDADPEVNPDTVHDLTKKLPEYLHLNFDIVYASHVMEHLPRGEVIQAFLNLREALRVGGEMWIVVPAMEWAARELLKDNPSPVVQPFIYGSQDNEYQYHKTGYTLVMLRSLFSKLGLITRKAYQTDFYIDWGDKRFTAKQNIIIGLKHIE